MKRSKRSFLVKMALLVMVTVGLSSCRRTDVHDALVRAEALMESDPHAARALLAEIEDSILKIRNYPAEEAGQKTGKNLQSSIFNFQSKDAALYALLRTQADYKCRIRLTSDSLPLVATSYYGTRRKTQRAALAQYYLGCTYSDMSRDLDAIDAFLRATILFPDTTNKYYAYSFFELGKLYLAHEKKDEALTAFQHYRLSNACQSDSANIGYGDMFIGMSYLYMNQADQAEPYFLKVIENPFMSKSYIDNARFQLAKLYAFLNEDYAKAKPYLEQSIAGYKDKVKIGAAFFLKADIFLHENKLDSAFYYYKKVLQCEEDTQTYYETYRKLVELSITLCKTDSLDSYFRSYMAFADSVSRIRRDKEISDIENNHVVELHDRELAVQRSRLYWTWGILFVFLVFIASMVILLNDRRRKTEKLKYEEALNAIKQRYIAQTIFTLQGGSLPASPPIAVQKERIAIYQKRYESSEWKRYFNKHLSEIKNGLFMPAAEATQFEQYLSDLFVDMLLDMFRDNEGLTDQEAQLCAMMLLGFKANQIAFVSRISADAVYMRRSRLKKRLTSNWSDFIFPASSPKP